MKRSLPTRVAALVGLLVVAVAAPAWASWLQPHTLQESVPLAENERSLVAGKSWMVTNLHLSWKQSKSHFIGASTFNPGSTEGTHWEKEKNDGVWNYRRIGLGVTWGFSKNVDIFAEVPILIASVRNSQMIGDDGAPAPTTSWGLGDIHGGFRFQLLRSQAEDGRSSNSLVAEFNARFPTGFESPGGYLPGPNNVVTILTGTGTWGFDIGARFKQQLAIFALEFGLGFTWNPSATVQYLVEDVNNQFNQHLDPGDVIHGNFAATVQFFKHLAFKAGIDARYRTKTKWGRTVASFPACKECVPIEGSDGLWLDGRLSLISDFDVHFGVDAYFEYTLAGRRNFLWPLEELSPSRGWTGGLDFQYRF